MITLYQLLPQILDCFGDKKPSTIIIGGSYSTNEAAWLSLNKKIYALSDYDLLCVNETEYSKGEKYYIYKNMLHLSNSILQDNPYFHIGLKIRTLEELKREANTLYFKELSVTGKTLIGNDFSCFFESPIVFGFDNTDITSLYHKLFYCGLARLWCNILFFPIKIFFYKKDIKWNIWYSYFLSRGAMDWITFKLIENNAWKPTYEERFETWKNLFADKKSLKILQQCLDIKLGKYYVDFSIIFKEILDLSILQIMDYAQKNNILQLQELDFIVSMLQFIDHFNNTYKCNEEYLETAMNSLAGMTRQTIELSNNSWHSWHILRCIYSDYRFSRNETDKIDHLIYTTNFLKLGNL